MHAVLPRDLGRHVIEITEHEEIAANEALQRPRQRPARARRAGIALDDDCAGYAGLEHVMCLRPDVIKLDRSISITRWPGDPAGARCSRRSCATPRDIHATVCAEGIETLEDLDRLAAPRRRLGQGYGARAARAALGIGNPTGRATLRRRSDGRAGLARPGRRRPSLGRRGCAARGAGHRRRLAWVLETVQRELRCEHIVVHERSAGDTMLRRTAGSTTEDLVRDVLLRRSARQALTERRRQGYRGAAGAGPRLHARAAHHLRGPPRGRPRDRQGLPCAHEPLRAAPPGHSALMPEQEEQNNDRDWNAE